ncbi:zinc finger protein 32-like [Cheilinus undulatus]|uniref:zinc finger protein 32-like n=1 Tax=Cheilinus undulatus TaxID=241271 RepID=UPI001BD1F473|nr:zinc finger protein 32-like [Cheilinus undulatus]
MFKTEELRASVCERLNAAAEEIFTIFEKTLQDYEQTLLRSKIKDEQQRLEEWKAPQQLCVQEDDAPSVKDHCARSDVCEKDQEPPQIKEERGEQLWTAQSSENQDEADAKDSVFNIIYVQRCDEEGKQITNPNQCFQNKRDSLPGEQLKSDPERDGFCVPKPTGDCQKRGLSDDEWRVSGGFNPGGKTKKLQQASEISDRPHTCSVCNKTFRIKSILTRHMKTHTGEKPYSCSICGKSFIQRSYLRTHMNSHSGQKPHRCRICGRGFTQVGNMNAHIRIHTGEKPHSCFDCGKRFREKADLTKHRIIHTGEKPFICTVCHMKFTSQSNLTRHMKTHSGERPFSCTTCGKRFIRRSHLISHMKTHTGENL